LRRSSLLTALRLAVLFVGRCCSLAGAVRWLVLFVGWRSTLGGAVLTGATRWLVPCWLVPRRLTLVRINAAHPSKMMDVQHFS